VPATGLEGAWYDSPMSLRVKSQARIRAPFERVRSAVANFSEIARWNPTYEDVHVEGSGVGAIRTYRFSNAAVRERLDEVAEDGRGYRYTQLEGPFESEVSGYVWVTPEGDDAVIEWSAKLKHSMLPPELAMKMMQSILDATLAAAKAQLEDAA
jgi:carbon monoxide dehydrogenase subunit G